MGPHTHTHTLRRSFQQHASVPSTTMEERDRSTTLGKLKSCIKKCSRFSHTHSCTPNSKKNKLQLHKMGFAPPCNELHRAPKRQVYTVVSLELQESLPDGRVSEGTRATSSGGASSLELRSGAAPEPIGSRKLYGGGGSDGVRSIRTS